MPRTRQAAAQTVADHLFALEEAVDVAVTRAAQLTAAMPTARVNGRLPAMIGQDALDRAAEAMTSLVQARRQIVETHHKLDVARAQLGLAEVNVGDILPKPSPTIPQGQAAPLRRVA